MLFTASTLYATRKGLRDKLFFYIRVQISCLSLRAVLPCCCPNYPVIFILKSTLLFLTGFSAVQLPLPGDCKLLRVVVHAGQRRWSLKRFVQPRPQIPIEEQLLSQQRRQRRQRPAKLRFQRYFSTNIAISAVHTWVRTALALVPTNVLIRRCCLIHLKNNCQGKGLARC